MARPGAGPDGSEQPLPVVAAGHPATAASAVEVLRLGGNAVDAAVAAGCTAAVAEPCLTSLGGGGFAMVRTSAGEETLVDFFVASPGLEAHRPPDPAGLVGIPIRFSSAVQEFHVGPASVAVPGVLAGYLHLHRRFGRLPLDVVLAGPARTARRGVAVGRFSAYTFELLAPILSRTATGRMLWFRGDRPLVEGDTMENPALADFLDDVAAGRRDGFTADDLGGAVTEADISAYEVVEREPLHVAHRGAELLLNPAPSFGGRLVAHALGLLAGAPPMRSDSDRDAVVALAEALVALHEFRLGLGEGTSRGTTHLGVADAEGNLVSMTTSNGSGSGEFADGLGVQLNNMMGESDLHPAGFGTLAPGRRIGSMMSPAILRAAGRTVALGSGGSERIRSVITQLAVRLVDADAPLTAAVAAPRLHWDGSVLQTEPGWPPGVLAALAERWPLNVWDGPDIYFGGAHLVADDGEAAGDVRRGGAVGRPPGDPA